MFKNDKALLVKSRECLSFVSLIDVKKTRSVNFFFRFLARCDVSFFLRLFASTYFLVDTMIKDCSTRLMRYFESLKVWHKPIRFEYLTQSFNCNKEFFALQFSSCSHRLVTYSARRFTHACVVTGGPSSHIKSVCFMCQDTAAEDRNERVAVCWNFLSVPVKTFPYLLAARGHLRGVVFLSLTSISVFYLTFCNCVGHSYR